MKGSRGIFGTAKADFLERVRKFSFFGMAALLIFTAFWFVPRTSNSGFSVLVIEPERFLQGSDPSWIPMASAMCGGMFLCLIGFAYIKNSVQHDLSLGIFHVVQVSPLKRSVYLFGKFLSSFLLLLLLLGLLAAASFVTMIIRFPGKLISLYSFFSPFLCVIPGLLFVDAFALFTDCAPGFRRSSGFSFAIFLSFSICVLTFNCFDNNPYRLFSIFDFSGFLWMRSSISEAAKAASGSPISQISILTNYHAQGQNLQRLPFYGLMPSAAFLSDKAVLTVFSLLLVLLSSFMLPKSQKAAALSVKRKAGKAADTQIKIPPFHFGLAHSEAAILLKDQPVFWWVAAAALWIANCFSPMDAVRSAIFPLAFAWMLPAFSRMGCLEYQTGMASVLCTISGAPARQALSCWHVGFSISVLTALPVLLRLLFSGSFAELASALVFTVFIPSAALFLGEWTKTSRPFEILFLIICFLIMNAPQLVFIGRLFTTASALQVTAAAVAAAAMMLFTFLRKWMPHLSAV